MRKEINIHFMSDRLGVNLRQHNIEDFRADSIHYIMEDG